MGSLDENVVDAVRKLVESFRGFDDAFRTGFLDYAVVRRREFEALASALEALDSHEAVRRMPSR